MQEHKPIPALGLSAIAMFQANQQRLANALAVEVAEAMGLPAADGWKIDFAQGVAFRDVPDQAPAAPGAPVLELVQGDRENKGPEQEPPAPPAQVPAQDPAPAPADAPEVTDEPAPAMPAANQG